MEFKIKTLEGEDAGSITVADSIFGLEPRVDILQRCVNWQLAKRQAGTHAVKNRADINRTGKKIYRQKGTGGARHGSARANLFRGGGRAFGPVVRSHAIALPKKVRALALRHALSAKVKDGDVIVIDKAILADLKTKSLKTHFGSLGLTNALIIDGAQIENNFRLAARNIPNVDVLPVQGINVYDIMRRTKLVLTKAALDALEARFK
jgi:large subunit ribosomal protein L4